MNKVLYLLFLFFAFSFTSRGQSNLEIKKVSVKEFHDLSKSMDCPIVDIRTSQEFDEEHLVNSVNIDFYDSSFYNKISRYKNNPLLLYDRSGNRSNQAIVKLKESGFGQVYVLQEGLVGWKRAGYGTTRQ